MVSIGEVGSYSNCIVRAFERVYVLQRWWDGRDSACQCTYLDQEVHYRGKETQRWWDGRDSACQWTYLDQEVRHKGKEEDSHDADPSNPIPDDVITMSHRYVQPHVSIQWQR